MPKKKHNMVGGGALTTEHGLLYETYTDLEEALRKAGLINKKYAGVKVLGDGELTVKLTVKASKVSASAKAKIEKAGGTVEVI